MKGSNIAGSIFVIGGNESKQGDMPVLRAFAARCGGAKAKLIFVTSASDDITEKKEMYGPPIRELGLKNTVFFHPKGKGDKDPEQLMDALAKADGVFLAGGSQAKLVSRLGNSEFMEALKVRLGEGLHLAGTSAGASAMSAVMIASGKSGLGVAADAVRLTRGLAILPDVVIDQHFRQRGRLGRLIAATLQNPGLLGIGLDEDTALEVRPGQPALVHGAGCVTVVDAKDTYSDSGLAFSDLAIHVLTSGWTLDLAARKAVAPCPG